MFEKSQEETLEYLLKAAVAAESLREQWPKLVFSLGSELTLFMQGILEGNNLLERMNNPSFMETVKTGGHNKKLNEFLTKASEAVRDVFHGKITYFSVSLESVDWSSFDFIGVDLYRDEGTRDAYGRMVSAYTMHNKPVLIGEFGCCTYQGAEKLGGMGWAIMFGMLTEYLHIDIQSLPKTIAYVIKVPARVDGHYIRDEGLQAHELTDQLRALDAAGVDGTFVFTFVSPTSYHNEDPRYDSDMASYSLVKSYAKKENLGEMIKETVKHGKELLGVDVDPDQLAKFVGDVGKHGTTYPDMPWEPKESFRAVADYYAKH